MVGLGFEKCACAVDATERNSLSMKPAPLVCFDTTNLRRCQFAVLSRVKVSVRVGYGKSN